MATWMQRRSQGGLGAAVLFLSVGACQGEPQTLEGPDDAPAAEQAAVAASGEAPLIGKTSCDGVNCNYCVRSVREQFKQLTANPNIDDWFAGSLPYESRAYPPSNLRANEVFEDAVIQSDHVQGFVRTQDHYAIAFDDSETGTITIANRDSLSIDALHLADETHPSGLFSIGAYVGYISHRDHIQFYDERSPLEAPLTRRPLPPGNADAQPGQGASMVATADGYVMMTTQKRDDEMWTFWNRLRGSNPTSFENRDEFLGGGHESALDGWEWQNSSLVTECETGHVYAVHVTGSDVNFLPEVTSSSSQWDLAQVFMTGKKPFLRHVDLREPDEDNDFCYTRGGASATGDASGSLHLVCASRSTTDGAFGIGDRWLPVHDLPSGPHGQGDTLRAGDVLAPNESLRSADGRYQFIYQGDGNLVLYRTSDNKPLWASKTRGYSLGVVTMQSDGNLVNYSAPFNGVNWAAGTQNHAGSRLLIQNDGNAVIYDKNNKAIWATKTRQ